MTMTYQEQDNAPGRHGPAAILDLTARHNRAYSDGDRERWIATFRHSGASYTRDGDAFTDLRAAFDGGDGQRLVTSITRSASTGSTRPSVASPCCSPPCTATPRCGPPGHSATR